MRQLKVLIASFLVFSMVICVLPINTYAAENTTGKEVSGVEINKKIELQSDGTYDLTLEAYVTGKVHTEEKQEAVPTDFVLVLDQSGSMSSNFVDAYVASNRTQWTYSNIVSSSWGQMTYYYYKDSDGSYYRVNRGNNNGNYYATYTKNGETITLGTSTNQRDVLYSGILYEVDSITRLQALKNAVNEFNSSVKKNAEDNSVNHRIGIVGFACSDNEECGGRNCNYKNTELFIGSNQYKYESSEIAQQYGNALQDVQTKMNNLEASVNALEGSGDTFQGNGIEMANNIFAAYQEANDYQYTKVDGTKADRNRVIVIFTDGNPAGSGSDVFDKAGANNAINKAYTSKNTYKAKVYTIGIFSSVSTNIDTLMNGMSSNFPNARSMTELGDAITNKIYYKLASDAGSLSGIFQEITTDINTNKSDYTLTSDAVMKDIITDNFNVTTETTKGLLVHTVPCTGQDTDGNPAWGEPVKNEKVTHNIEDKTVTVTGFDYSSDENCVIKEENQGNKLIVTIPGLTAVGSGNKQYSNTDKSGIYLNGEEIVLFDNPTVDIPRYSYVLDYGHKALASNDTLNVTGVSQLNENAPAPPDVTSIDSKYGTFTKTNKGLQYKPETFVWDGYDTAYAFGEVKAGTSTDGQKYKWFGVDFIPANNVYYEDDFMLKENKTDTSVSIVYGGDWIAVDDSGDELDNDYQSDKTQNVDNSETHGWDEMHDGEGGASSGSQHRTNGNSDMSATATFTFKGTGVDVYSRTNENTGSIIAQLFKGDSISDGSVAQKALMVDNLAMSGDYYQIPTLFFHDLDYDTYTVKITVLAGTTSITGTERKTYYLDGIRVYNPLNNNVTDEIVNEAYDEAGEYDTRYVTLRDTLLDKTTISGSITEEKKLNPTEGTLFIDYNNVDYESPVTSEYTDMIATYKNLGPKNEIYLAPGKAITFTLSENVDDRNVMVGARSLNGKMAEITVTRGNNEPQKIALNSKSDRYYKVTATSANTVVIANTGNAVVSLTKLRLSGVSAKATALLMVTNDTLEYAARFNNNTVTSDESESEQAALIGDVEVQNYEAAQADIEGNEAATETWYEIEASAEEFLGQ